MRQVINISLPQKMARELRVSVKKEGFATVSEFFRHLLRLYNTYRLAEQIKKDRKDFEAGKGKVLRSLKDLR